MIVDKIKKRETKNLKAKKSTIDIPIGKWIKCEACKEILYRESVRENLNICPNCGHYFRMHVGKRLELMIDEGTYQRFDWKLETTNPLELEDYPKELKMCVCELIDIFHSEGNSSIVSESVGNYSKTKQSKQNLDKTKEDILIQYLSEVKVDGIKVLYRGADC